MKSTTVKLNSVWGIYRANKIKKGRRAIRKQHYRLHPHDLVKYQNQIWQVKGVQNRGKYIKLTKKISKRCSY